MTHTYDPEQELPTHLLRCFLWAEEFRAACKANDQRRIGIAGARLAKHRLWMIRYFTNLETIAA